MDAAIPRNESITEIDAPCGRGQQNERACRAAVYIHAQHKHSVAVTMLFQMGSLWVCVYLDVVVYTGSASTAGNNLSLLLHAGPRAE